MVYWPNSFFWWILWKYTYVHESFLFCYASLVHFKTLFQNRFSERSTVSWPTLMMNFKITYNLMKVIIEFVFLIILKRFIRINILYKSGNLFITSLTVFHIVSVTAVVVGSHAISKIVRSSQLVPTRHHENNNFIYFYIFFPPFPYCYSGLNRCFCHFLRVFNKRRWLQ